MHQDVASRPALKVGAKVLGIVAFFSDPGTSEVGEVLVFRNPNATPFEDNAVAPRANEADRRVQRVQSFDPGFTAR